MVDRYRAQLVLQVLLTAIFSSREQPSMLRTSSGNPLGMSHFLKGPTSAKLHLKAWKGNLSTNSTLHSARSVVLTSITIPVSTRNIRTISSTLGSVSSSNCLEPSILTTPGPAEEGVPLCPDQDYLLLLGPGVVGRNIISLHPVRHVLLGPVEGVYEGHPVQVEV